MALTKVQAEGINLADTFAFTGTISGSGTRQLIRAVTISSNTNTVEFIHGSNNVVLDSTYSRYEITLDTVVPTSETQLRFFLSADGGSNYYGDDVYSFLVQRAYTNGSSTAQDVNFNNDYVMSNFSTANTAANKGGIDGFVAVTNLGTAHRTIFHGHFNTYDHSNYYTHVEGIGAYESNTQTIDAIQIKFSSGDIASGKFKLFGVR